MVIQTNKQRFLDAKAANPSGVVYALLSRGHEILFVANDKQRFADYLFRENRTGAVTVIETVANMPETSCYYGQEEWLAKSAVISKASQSDDWLVRANEGGISDPVTTIVVRVHFCDSEERKYPEGYVAYREDQFDGRKYGPTPEAALGKLFLDICGEMNSRLVTDSESGWPMSTFRVGTKGNAEN